MIFGESGDMKWRMADKLRWQCGENVLPSVPCLTACQAFHSPIASCVGKHIREMFVFWHNFSSPFYLFKYLFLPFSCITPTPLLKRPCHSPQIRIVCCQLEKVSERPVSSGFFFFAMCIVEEVYHKLTNGCLYFPYTTTNIEHEPFNSCEWPRQISSLQYLYNITQTSDENKEKHQIWDY